jgi:hypothetical protein
MMRIGSHISRSRNAIQGSTGTVQFLNFRTNTVVKAVMFAKKKPRKKRGEARLERELICQKVRYLCSIHGGQAYEFRRLLCI